LPFYLLHAAASWCVVFITSVGMGNCYVWCIRQNAGWERHGCPVHFCLVWVLLPC